MGIEPTEPAVYASSNGFEIRGHHQASKHFHRLTYCNESRAAYPDSGGAAYHDKTLTAQDRNIKQFIRSTSDP